MNKEIAELDSRIINLLNERSSLYIEELKKSSQIQEIYSPADQTDTYNHITSLNNGPLSNRVIKDIFTEMISCSRKLVQPAKIAYLGPEGTFSYQAILEIFGSSVEAVPQNTIASVFDEVESGSVSFGVVPVENSTEGSVSYTLDELMNTGLKIQSEKFLRIMNCLLSGENDLSRIKKVYSHPQPLAQCKNWLRTNLPDARIVQTASTILAAENAAAESLSAAIASEKAADRYELNLLARNIDDYKNNYTRFFIIGHKENPPTGNDKTSIVFGIKDSPGALYDILEPFRNAGINLSKIESRPNKKEMWAYNFFVDFTGHSSEKNVIEVLDILKKNVLFLKILGSYPVLLPISRSEG
ncbi:MAG: prephenate dehydratase [Spirochaetes bacterium]|nr:prephenate dehydratase [Spirochaetota bacterium]